MGSLQTHLKELKATTDPKAVKELVKIHAPLIKAMKAVIKKAETAIIKKIEANELTRRQYMLLLSIPCIGPVTGPILLPAPMHLVPATVASNWLAIVVWFLLNTRAA